METIQTRSEYPPIQGQFETASVEVYKPNYFEQQIIDWVIHRLVKKERWQKYFRSRLIHT